MEGNFKGEEEFEFFCVNYAMPEKIVAVLMKGNFKGEEEFEFFCVNYAIPAYNPTTTGPATHNSLVTPVNL